MQRAYNETNWVNDTAPAINQTNLNKIEKGIKDSISGVNELNAYSELANKGFDTFGNYGNFVNGGLKTDGTIQPSQPYRVSSETQITLDRDIIVKVKNGFRWGYCKIVGGVVTWNGWYNSDVIVPVGTTFTVQIARTTENTSEIANIIEFVTAITFDSILYEDLNTTNTKILRAESQITPIEEYVGKDARINLMLGVNTTKGRMKTDTGAVEVLNDYQSTDFIPVDASTDYVINFSYWSSGNYGLVYYDSSKQYINGTKQSATSSSSLNPFTFTTPSTCAFVRFSIPTTLISVGDVDFELNTIPKYHDCYILPFTENNFDNKMIDSTGALTTDSNFVSCVINVEGVVAVNMYEYRLSGAGAKGYAFYSETPSASTMISVGGAMSASPTWVNETVDVPSGAKYMVISARSYRPTISLYFYLAAIFKKIFENEKTELVAFQYDYEGQKISFDNKYSCKLVGDNVILGWVSGSITDPTTQLSGQGADIYDKYLFRAHDKGYIRVYDLSDLKNITFVNHFEIDGYGANVHCNTICFAPTVENGNDFPYLYVTDLYNAPVCYVEEVTTTTATKVQTITVDSSVTTNQSVQFTVSDDGFLYVFTAVNNNSVDKNVPTQMKFYKFNLPEVSSGDVTLTSEDIIDSWTVDGYIYTDCPWQGMKVKQNRWYLVFGNSLTSRKIRIWDVKTHQEVTEVDITIPITVEPEDVCFYENTIFVLRNGVGANQLFFK